MLLPASTLRVRPPSPVLLPGRLLCLLPLVSSPPPPLLLPPPPLPLPLLLLLRLFSLALLPGPSRPELLPAPLPHSRLPPARLPPRLLLLPRLSLLPPLARPRLPLPLLPRLPLLPVPPPLRGRPASRFSLPAPLCLPLGRLLRPSLLPPLRLAPLSVAAPTGGPTLLRPPAATRTS